MSYIRCASNPEGLYIFESGAGFEVFHNVQPPLSSSVPNGESPGFIVPRGAFRDTCKRWEDGAKKTSRQGFDVEMVFVYTDTARRVRSIPKSPKALATYRLDPRPRQLFVRLAHEKHFVHLWFVTWMYVVHNVINERG